MRCLTRVLMSLLLFVPTALWAGPVVMVDQQQLQEQLEMATLQIQAIEQQLKSDPTLLKKVSPNLEQAKKNLEALRQLLNKGYAPRKGRAVTDARGQIIDFDCTAVAAAQGGPDDDCSDAPPPAPAPVAAARGPVDQKTLDGMIAAVKGEKFSSDQLRVLETLAQGRTFTIAQVSQLITPLSMESDRVQAVRVLSSHVMDPQNSYQLYTLFTFSSSKEEIKKIFAMH